MQIDSSHRLFLDLARLSRVRILQPITVSRPVQPVYTWDGITDFVVGPTTITGLIEVPDDILKAAELWDEYAGMTLEEFINKTLG